MDSRRKAVSEVVVWNGKTYRRYPNSKYKSIRMYFCCGKNKLHRDIWAATYGKIPPNHHIHHKDNNHNNNDISNLLCIPAAEHYALHGAERAKQSVTAEEAARLRAISQKAAEWHRSEEGRLWHREHAKTVLKKARAAINKENWPELNKFCEVCGGAFTTREVQKRVCSRRCNNKKSHATAKAKLAIKGNSGDNKTDPV